MFRENLGLVTGIFKGGPAKKTFRHACLSLIGLNCIVNESTRYKKKMPFQWLLMNFEYHKDAKKIAQNTFELNVFFLLNFDSI